MASGEPKGEACWNCQMLGKPYNGEKPCQNCSVETDALALQGCPRGQLADEVVDLLPTLALRSGKWEIPGGDGFMFHVRITYEELGQVKLYEMSDYRPRTDQNGVPLELAISPTDFLKQFKDVGSIWQGCYAGFTNEILRRCARFQEDLLRNHHALFSPAFSPMTGDEDSLIARSLRCLMFTREIGIADFLTQRHQWKVENKFFAPFVGWGDFPPRIKVIQTRSSGIGNSDKPQPLSLPPHPDDSLSSMLHDIVRTTQRIIFRRRRSDSVHIFYMLCILKLIVQDLSPTTRWMSHIAQAGRVLDGVVTRLCQLYHVVNKGKHPLTKYWAEEKCRPAVEDLDSDVHSDGLNELWEDASRGDTIDDAVGESGFSDRLGEFVEGFDLGKDWPYEGSHGAWPESESDDD